MKEARIISRVGEQEKQQMELCERGSSGHESASLRGASIVTVKLRNSDGHFHLAVFCVRVHLELIIFIECIAVTDV